MNKNLLILLTLMFILSGCLLQSGGDGGTTSGDPLVEVEFEPYNQSLAKKISNLFIKEAYAGVTSLNFCFKRMRFKADDSDLGADVELDLGEVVIKPEGTPLGKVQIASGVYKRVEFDLEKDCDGTTKPSVSFTNDFGAQSTDDRITIRFEGEFNPANEDLSMFVQNIVNSIKNYNGTGTIKDALEGASGTF